MTLDPMPSPLLWFLSAALCLVTHRSAAEEIEWPQDMPPPKFDEQLWEVAKMSVSEPVDSPKCIQIKKHRHAMLCITELEWRRLHEGDK
ncbi:MAG: hypothetical protein HYX63_13440 [Gammaproteobacteria bacterium]|nr:hypothetical protein [Gammaproteobacteria bacterium]